MASPRLSIVVPTRNRAHLLGECLDALIAQQLEAAEYEIVVVDNASSDGTASVVEGRMGPGVPLRRVEARVPGLNRARNVGLEEAEADAIAFIDDDVLVPRDYASRVLAALDAHPGAGGVGGPFHDDPAGTGGRTCARCSLGSVSIAAEDGRTLRLLGGNMVLRRSAVEVVGPFDPALSGKGDETEWFVRSRSTGHWFHYDESLAVAHRRDVFPAHVLLWVQFRQGWARPLADRKMGREPMVRYRLAGRWLAHGVRRRCLKGFVMVVREAGAAVGAARLRLKPSAR